MSKKILEAVNAKIEGIVSGLGYDILDVEYAKQPAGFNLTVTIDKEGGVTIEDCETVHRAIDTPLDELDDLFPEGYFLNVSSPGLTRSLKNLKDFRRNEGKEIEVKFYKSQDGAKTLKGTLLSYTENDFVIETGEGKKTIDKKLAANIVPAVDFAALLREKENGKK